MEIFVVKVIDENKVVINKGSVDGIKENMEFVVYIEGEEVFDPISKKSLGFLETSKGTFKPFHIQDRMATLTAKIRRPNEMMKRLMIFESSDIELPLKINVGDKVKIINQVD